MSLLELDRIQTTGRDKHPDLNLKLVYDVHVIICKMIGTKVDKIKCPSPVELIYSCTELLPAQTH